MRAKNLSDCGRNYTVYARVCAHWNKIIIFPIPVRSFSQGKRDFPFKWPRVLFRAMNGWKLPKIAGNGCAGWLPGEARTDDRPEGAARERHGLPVPLRRGSTPVANYCTDVRSVNADVIGGCVEPWFFVATDRWAAGCHITTVIINNHVRYGIFHTFIKLFFFFFPRKRD